MKSSQSAFNCFFCAERRGRVVGADRLEHMDAEEAGVFHEHTEWGSVFLTLESGGTNILNILRQDIN